jgi:TRAP-type mannitol/chloroaromatic compound transport system permease small subunit
MKRLIGFLDWTSRAIASGVMIVMLLLVGVMIFEVIMRRFLNSPTLWAFDVSYMLNGCIFIGASSYALLNDAHVKVTFLSDKFSDRGRELVNTAFYILLFLPVVGFLAYASVQEAVESFTAGTIERVSPWAPKIWPFYTALAIGVCGFWLQGLSQALKNLLSVAADIPVSNPAAPATAAIPGE